MGRKIPTKVVGVTQPGRQDVIKTIQEGDELFLEREPNNPVDKNAIKVLTHRKDEQVGYIRKELAAELAERMDMGAWRYKVIVMSVTGGVGEKQFRGCNIRIDEELK